MDIFQGINQTSEKAVKTSSWSLEARYLRNLLQFGIADLLQALQV